MYVIGDAHGQLNKVRSLLRNARIIDEHERWIGANSSLWFTGDFCDRGPNGIGVIQLVMRLQREAHERGGSVGALLGNHEIMLLGAYQFPDHRATFGSTYHDVWSYNGGREEDRQGLSDQEVMWLGTLPAMANVDGVLMIHCDSTFYRHYGSRVESVNETVHQILSGEDLGTWDELMETYFERGSFVDRRDGVAAARGMLATFGGNLIVHGHTPIPYLTQQDPSTVLEPLVYADDLCMDVDGGMYMGGPGFVVELAGQHSQPSTPLMRDHN